MVRAHYLLADEFRSEEIVFGSFPPRCFKTDRLHKRQLKTLGEMNAHNRPIKMQSLKTEGNLLTHYLTFSKPSLACLARQLRNAVGPFGHPRPTLRISRADINPRNFKIMNLEDCQGIFKSMSYLITR